MLIIFTKLNEEFGVRQIVATKEFETHLSIEEAKVKGIEIAATLSDVMGGAVEFLIDTGKGIHTKVSDILHESK